MKELLKITKQKLDNHFHYGKWYYIVAIILVVVIVSLAYSTTMPEYPKENTISIVMYAGIGEEEVIDVWEKEMLSLLPDDQREVNIVSSVPMDASTQSVVVARMVATQDDIMVINTEDMHSYTQEGAFLPLDEYLDIEKIFEEHPEININEYTYELMDFGGAEPHVYWLPLSVVDGFDEIGLIGDNLGIGILSNSVNVDNAVICLEYIMSK